MEIFHSNIEWIIRIITSSLLVVSDNCIDFNLINKRKSIFPDLSKNLSSTIRYIKLNSRFVYYIRARNSLQRALSFSRWFQRQESMRGGLIFLIETRDGRWCFEAEKIKKKRRQRSREQTSRREEFRAYISLFTNFHFSLKEEKEKEREEKRGKERKLHKKGKIEGARVATSRGRRRSLSGATTCFVIH